MKKIGIIIISFLLFIVGANCVKAALVSGEDIYHFDLTMDHKQFSNYYDTLANSCLLDFVRSDSEDAYTEAWNYDNQGSAFVTFKKADKDLYVWSWDNGYIDKLDAIGEDNYVADISEIDEEECQELVSYGYNKIAVYFESDEEIPVIKDFTFDFTKDIATYINNERELYFIIFQVLMVNPNDDILPNLDLSHEPDLPLILSKNGIDFVKFDYDEDNDELLVELLNKDKFSTDDNFIIDPADLVAAFPESEYGEFGRYMEYLSFMFDKINIVVSHNEPKKSEEAKPEEAKAEKNEEKIPPTGDHLLEYTFTIGLSLTGFILLKKKQSN